MAIGTKQGSGLNPGGTLELPVGTAGWLVVKAGSVLGKLEVDSSSGEMTFKWASSGDAWPSYFDLEEPDGHTVPSLNAQHKYEHQTFGSSTSYDVSGCDYKIVNGGNTVGWLKVNANDTEWYGVPAYVSGGYLSITGDSISFEANDATGNETAHRVVDDLL